MKIVFQTIRIYAPSLNFKAEDTETRFSLYKRYLAIFGTINQKDVDCDVIIHCFTDIQDLEDKKKNL